jgi:hypothetical protein
MVDTNEDLKVMAKDEEEGEAGEGKKTKRGRKKKAGEGKEDGERDGKRRKSG